MADKVDLSLDDIIKMNKKTGNNQRGNKPNKPNVQRLKSLGARSGIVRKGGPKQIGTRQQQVSPKKEATMLHVSNLHFNVSNRDVRELFSDIGPVKKAVVHYDKSGRSLGTAEVTFLTRDAAIRAIEKYHQLPLDGRPMTITLVPSQTNTRSPTKSRIGIKAGSGIYKQQRPQTKVPRKGQTTTKGRQTNTRTGGKSHFKPKTGQRQPRKQVTAEDLDADLEAYTMKVDG